MELATHNGVVLSIIFVRQLVASSLTTVVVFVHAALIIDRRCIVVHDDMKRKVAYQVTVKKRWFQIAPHAY